VARQYGAVFPERPVMAVLSDLLGIPHFTTSRGSTVRTDFLRAVLEALGGDPEGRSKEDLIIACIEAADPRKDGRRFLSPGGTVTNEALQAMVDGIVAHRPGTTPPEIPVGEAEVLVFDPAQVADTRHRELAERAAREGQDKFRTAVLAAYGGRCALTGADAPSALEAAHITPYRGADTNVVPNGLCLRADLHRLWDSGQIALDEETHEILVVDALKATTYGQLDGTRAVNIPRERADRPSTAALVAHRNWCGL